MNIRSTSLDESSPTHTSGATSGFTSPIGLSTRRNSSDGLTPLGRHDKQLASYIVARYADRRKVGPQEFEQLKRCNLSLKESRDEFHVGRGNVKTDLARSAGNTYLLNEAVRKTLLQQNRHAELTESEAVGVAASHHVGKCQEHGKVALHAHAPRLQAGEKVELRKDSLGDHGFAVHVGTDGTKIAIDPWGEGPAVNALDGAYTDGGVTLVTTDTITPEDAPKRLKEFRRGYEQLGPALSKPVEEKRAELKSAHAKPAREPWSPQAVVSQSFSERVERAIAKGPQALLDANNGWIGAAKKAASTLWLKKHEKPSTEQQWAAVLDSAFAHAGANEFAQAILNNPLAVTQIVQGAGSLRTPDPSRGGTSGQGESASSQPREMAWGERANCYAYALKCERPRITGMLPQACPGAASGPRVHLNLGDPAAYADALVQGVIADGQGAIRQVEGSPAQVPTPAPGEYLFALLTGPHGFHFLRRDSETECWSWKDGNEESVKLNIFHVPSNKFVPVTDELLEPLLSTDRQDFVWRYHGLAFKSFFAVLDTAKVDVAA